MKEIDKKQSRVVLVLDVMFIMILCFMTLLTTMLMRGSVIVGASTPSNMKYAFGLMSFLATFTGLGIYLLFIIPNSNRELKNMINKLYK